MNPLDQVVPMKANTAVGFIAPVVSLLLTRSRPSLRRGLAARGLAALAIIIGCSPRG